MSEHTVLLQQGQRKGSKQIYMVLAGYILLFSSGLFLLLGGVTALLPNRFFIRMTPVIPLDYVYLTLTSLLSGTYISLHLYQKQYQNRTCTIAAYSGGAGGFLGFGCSLCNKPLLLLLGATGVLTYVEPYRPLMGGIGILLLAYAVYSKGRSVKQRETG